MKHKAFKSVPGPGGDIKCTCGQVFSMKGFPIHAAMMNNRRRIESMQVDEIRRRIGC